MRTLLEKLNIVKTPEVVNKPTWQEVSLHICGKFSGMNGAEPINKLEDFLSQGIVFELYNEYYRWKNTGKFKKSKRKINGKYNLARGYMIQYLSS